MLKQLVIQNYAIIDHIQIEFGPHLNIITGETGAGKSILTGALGLIQGNRADSKVLYDTSQKCIVEAEYIQNSDSLHALLEHHDIEADTTLTIRRIISTQGKSKAYINDEPVKLSVLKEITTLLVDLHKQFDTIGINDPVTQRSMLDAMADNQAYLEVYKDVFRAYKLDVKKLNELEVQEESVQKELDFAQFQIQELNDANFRPNEQVELEQEIKLLSNADAIESILQKINVELYDKSDSMTDVLNGILNELERIDSDLPALHTLKQQLYSTKEELIDIAQSASQMNLGFDLDIAQLEMKQERLDLIYRLTRKHHKEHLNDLLDYQAALANEIEALMSFSTNKSTLEKRIDVHRVNLSKWANEIEENRVRVKDEFAARVKSFLSQLGMEHAQFEVQILPVDEFTDSGKNEIQFLFSANPGKPVEDIKSVASGGELSRVALSLKSTVASKFDMPTLIFDEIDSGISGEVARKMGIILKDLANQHQVISITHSPQIAAKADTHFFVYKEVKDNRTFAKLKTLDRTGRVQELAKMLSGDPPSKSAIDNAIVLIDTQ